MIVKVFDDKNEIVWEHNDTNKSYEQIISCLTDFFNELPSESLEQVKRLLNS